MKKILIFIFIINLCCCNKKLNYVKLEEKQINFYINNHFRSIKNFPFQDHKFKKINDSLVIKKIESFNNSVLFFEKLTNIKADTQKTYISTRIIDKKLINSWIIWIKMNEINLFWDTNFNRVDKKNNSIW